MSMEGIVQSPAAEDERRVPSGPEGDERGRNMTDGSGHSTVAQLLQTRRASLPRGRPVSMCDDLDLGGYQITESCAPALHAKTEGPCCDPQPSLCAYICMTVCGVLQASTARRGLDRPTSEHKAVQVDVMDISIRASRSLSSKIMRQWRQLGTEGGVGWIGRSVGRLLRWAWSMDS